MKRFIHTLITSAVLMLAFSCQETELLEVDMNESIVLDLSSGETRADDSHAESFVSHLDIFIFKADQSGSGYTQGEKAYYGRYNVNNASSITLDAKRSSFGENDRFYVYLIANSTFTEDEMAAKVSTFNDLQVLKQEDAYIHLTGLTADNSPKYFLMDAIATQGTAKTSPVQLFNGVPADNTVLDAVLRRAAAKVFININAGADVEFHHYADDPESDGGLYYVRNLPYETFVLSGEDASTIEAKRKTTMKGTSAYFSWHPETSSKNVTLTVYVYPHHWTNASLLDHETCVIMNLPMIYKKGQPEEFEHKNSWYKIHMTADHMFERNKYYYVNIDLNAPGATSDSNPQVLEDLYYSVEDWTSVDVEVGGENRPNYLQLNTDHVDMYNVNMDGTTLRFASSSFIPADGIELLEAYYYDYLDRRVDLQGHQYGVYDDIKAVAEANVLNGGITITSPFVAMTEAQKEALIAQLTKPVLEEKEPEKPSGMPVQPLEVANPGDTKPADPNSDAVLDQIAEKYSNYFVEVTWTRNSQGNVTFTDGGWWSDAGENAQAEYEELLEAYENYDSLKVKYDKYLTDKATYESQMEEYMNSSEYQTYLSNLTAYEAAYEAYVQQLAVYNEQVADINSSNNEDTHSNAVRYLKFKVTNSTGQTAEFTVSQYPTLYITNEHGHYSYRSDFGGTTYYSAGSNRYNAAYWSDGRWQYARVNSNNNGYLFRSKYYNADQGDIDYYFWSNNANRGSYEAGSLTNPRMYHVHVTSTSSLYTVAIPKLDSNGYTASTADNSRLVSPSFMIASQLGATQSPGSLQQAASHCSQYVEVKEDGKEYDDWRLPTEAELEIIINHQYESDAMSEVLAGRRYWCAYTANGNNYVANPGSNDDSNSTAVRCVRDAY